MGRVETRILAAVFPATRGGPGADLRRRGSVVGWNSPRRGRSYTAFQVFGSLSLAIVTPAFDLSTFQRCSKWLYQRRRHAGTGRTCPSVPGRWPLGTSLLVRANLDAYRLVPGRDYGGGLYGNGRGYPGTGATDRENAWRAADRRPGRLVRGRPSPCRSPTTI